MQNPQRVDARSPEYARFARGEFSIAPAGLIRFLTLVEGGRNAWSVMMCLCKRIHADGTLGVQSREAISEETGLTFAQVSRGLADLRERQVIEPVKRRSQSGKIRYDRSNFGHVAQYRFTKEAWKFISAGIDNEE